MKSIKYYSSKDGSNLLQYYIWTLDGDAYETCLIVNDSVIYNPELVPDLEGLYELKLNLRYILSRFNFMRNYRDRHLINRLLIFYRMILENFSLEVVDCELYESIEDGKVLIDIGGKYWCYLQVVGAELLKDYTFTDLLNCDSIYYKESSWLHLDSTGKKRKKFRIGFDSCFMEGNWKDSNKGYTKCRNNLVKAIKSVFDETNFRSVFPYVKSTITLSEDEIDLIKKNLGFYKDKIWYTVQGSLKDMYIQEDYHNNYILDLHRKDVACFIKQNNVSTLELRKDSGVVDQCYRSIERFMSL